MSDRCLQRMLCNSLDGLPYWTADNDVGPAVCQLTPITLLSAPSARWTCEGVVVAAMPVAIMVLATIVVMMLVRRTPRRHETMVGALQDVFSAGVVAFWSSNCSPGVFLPV